MPVDPNEPTYCVCDKVVVCSYYLFVWIGTTPELVYCYSNGEKDVLVTFGLDNSDVSITQYYNRYYTM